jgi:uncharacterized repeat protein (TIGR01451 family)
MLCCCLSNIITILRRDMKHSHLARLLISTIGPALLIVFVAALPALATPTTAAPTTSSPLMFHPALQTSHSITLTKTEATTVSKPDDSDASAAARDLTVGLPIVSGRVEPGRKFSYSIYFSNAGSAAADNVVVTNTLPAGTTLAGLDYCTVSPTVNGQLLIWQLGNIPPGNSGYLGFSVQLTDTAVIGSLITDTVQIGSSSGEDNPANNQVSLGSRVTAPGRDLSVSKSLADAALVGVNTQYLIQYFNQGSLTATNLIITDVLPVSVTYLSYSGSNVNAVLTGSLLVFTQSLLAGDTGGIIQVDVRITDTAQPGQILTNIVRATTTDPEVNLANNVYTLTTPIVQPTRDVNVTKNVYSGTFQAGANVAYEVYLSNAGNYTATNVILTDTLPAHTSFLTWTGYSYNPTFVNLPGVVTPTVVGNQVIWNLGALAPDAYAYLNPIVQIDNSTPDNTPLNNLAQISTSDPETDYSNNTDSVIGVVTPFGGPDGSGYRFKDDSMPGGPVFNWLDVTDGTRSFVFGDDRSAGPTPLGFSFFYYGRVYTTTYLGTNGYMSFEGPVTAYINRNLPNSKTPNNFIAPFWDDLQVCPNQAKQAIYFKQGGSAPSRYFATEWAGVSHLSAPTNPITFETVLYENGEILFQYQSLTGTLTSASVGIENYAGLRGLQYEFNQDNLANGRAILFTPRISKVYLPTIYK